MSGLATQLNVRLDSDLRASGNAALEEAGITPSQAVRALWRKVSLRGDDLRQVFELLGLDGSSQEVEEECVRKAALARQGQTLFAEACAALDVAPPQPEETPCFWRDMRESAISQRLDERGMV